MVDAPIGPDEFDEALAFLPGLGRPLLVAVSGGPDSTALLHALASWARHRGQPGPTVATVDHGLRAEARTEAEAVAAAARHLGLEHRILTWTNQPARPSQARAREARYGLLAALARDLGGAVICTAHTLDDQAETILMRLAAGSGPAGLGGMKAMSRRGDALLARPFLRFPKSRLVATCRAEGWRFHEDPSNADPRFARARWRRLVPGLAAEGLDAEALGRLAERVRRAEAALEAAVDAAAARMMERNTPLAFAAVALFAEPDEIGLRLLGRAATAARGNATPSIRLARLESCHHEFARAHRESRTLRRTLAGCTITLDRAGRLRVEPESARRRGRGAAKDARGLANQFVAGSAASLGIGGTRA